MSNLETAIKVLTDKRGELLGALERIQVEQAKVFADLGTLDAAILMLDPDFKLEAVLPRHLPAIHHAGKGEMTILAFNILRDAKEPMSTQELNLKIMEARNINVNDPNMISMMQSRLHSSLRNHRGKGRLRSIKSEDGKYSLWELVR